MIREGRSAWERVVISFICLCKTIADVDLSDHGLFHVLGGQRAGVSLRKVGWQSAGTGDSQ